MSSRQEQYVGAGLLFLAAACNPVLLGTLFSTKGYLVPVTSIKIVAFELMAGVVGLLLFRGKRRLLILIATNVTIFCILLGAFEKLFELLNQNKLEEKIIKDFSGQFFFSDPQLGYRPPNDADVSVVGRSKGRKIYEANYSFDSFHRRVTPTLSEGSAEHHAIFFGCSYTLGQNVNNNETMPYYFAQNEVKYQAYNYGFSGYGTQQMLVRLKEKTFPLQIAQRTGIAVYTFIADHISRATGSMLTTEWTHGFPHYINRDGRLIHLGKFSDRTVRSWAFSFLRGSQILSFFNMDIPPLWLNLAADRELTYALIKESAKLYRQHFKSGRFYVLIFPGTAGYSEGLSTYLMTEGVKVLDFSSLYDRDQKELWIEIDQHPSPAGYGLVAKRLAETLRTLEEAPLVPTPSRSAD